MRGKMNKKRTDKVTVHFPVTGNNFFSSHVTFPLFLYPFQDLILIYRLLLLHLAVLFLPGIPGKLHHR